MLAVRVHARLFFAGAIRENFPAPNPLGARTSNAAAQPRWGNPPPAPHTPTITTVFRTPQPPRPVGCGFSPAGAGAVLL